MRSGYFKSYSQKMPPPSTTPHQGTDELSWWSQRCLSAGNKTPRNREIKKECCGVHWAFVWSHLVPLPQSPLSATLSWVREASWLNVHQLRVKRNQWFLSDFIPNETLREEERVHLFITLHNTGLWLVQTSHLTIYWLLIGQYSQYRSLLVADSYDWSIILQDLLAITGGYIGAVNIPEKWY